MQKKLVLSSEERVSLLLLLVKFYFIPMMAVFALNNFVDIVHYRNIFPLGIHQENIFRYYYPFLLSLIFFIDTIYFFIGYIIESRSFNNIVVSVESTTFGWLVALVCYPPFSNISNDLLGWHSQNFSSFGNISINVFMGGIALFLMSLYLWATISLGTRASNLTNRGIVSRGAYRFVRHPAYAAKNLTWWIMGIPLIFSPETVRAFSDSTFIHFVLNDLPKALIPFLSLFVWSSIYYLRAITEERHLIKDPSYKLYMEKVRYRFIPKIL